MPCRMMPRQLSQIALTISASTDNVNLFTLAGSPGVAVDVVCTINAGVTVGSTSTATPAFQTGAFFAGSTIRVVNHGRVAGKGGSGGDGANNSTLSNGTTGGDAGDAVSLACDVAWDNTTTGEVFGGGGGGGGGGRGTAVNPDDGNGGGGGGGQGRTNSAGGGGPGLASDGGTGTEASAGTGGNGNANGAKGGAGGSWGSAGKSGKDGDRTNGRAGGAAGKAVDLNGHAIDWIAGNNATQVKGAVS